VSLETNDDFAMGASPGAPGAIVDEGGGGRIGEDGRGGTGNVPDVTPRQVNMNLPGPVVSGRAGTIVAAHTAQRTRDNTPTTPTRTTTHAHHHHHLYLHHQRRKRLRTVHGRRRATEFTTFSLSEQVPACEAGVL
jgi:hypothetical protein